MFLVGRHTVQTDQTPRRNLVAYISIGASLLVWGMLVYFSVHLGAQADSAFAWILMCVATLGAVVALALAVLLILRAWEQRFPSASDDTGEPQAPGGRRAKRRG